jgi:transcriptional regulator with XRE-family HTH domain
MSEDREMDDRHVLPAGHGARMFAPLLREYRDRSRLSQSRLAEAAGFDHSYVSRLESGTRMPTREAVIKLGEAMRLEESDRDALLAAAGFMPGRIESLLAGEPVLSEALRLLQNRSIPAEIRDDVRNMIALLVRQAQRSALDVARASSHNSVVAA